MKLERKLRIALPKGWLIRPNRWNVEKVLKLAGIGQYYTEGKGTYFKSNDPEIEARVIRAKDIPFEISDGIYDLGITGEDFVKEGEIIKEVGFRKSLGYMLSKQLFRDIERRLSNKGGFTMRFAKGVVIVNPSVSDIRNRTNSNRPRKIKVPLELVRLYDLKCSYVDLAFITTNENLERVEAISRNLREAFPEDNRLALFFRGYYFYVPQKRNRMHNDMIPCKSIYPHLMDYFLDFAKKTNRFDIQEARGTTEEYLLNGSADLILESVATGDSLKKRNLAIIHTAMSSTAKLFMNPLIKEKIDLFGDEDARWRYEKAQEIRGRLEGVVRDVEAHCQIEIPLKLSRPFIWEAIHLFHQGPYEVLEDFSKLLKDVSCDHIFELEESRIKLKFTTKKTNLQRILGFSRAVDQTYREEDSIRRIDFDNIRAYHLQSLYLYCPFQEEDTGLDWEDSKTFKKRIYDRLSKLSLQIYPCADTSKLRPEHLTDALIKMPEGI